MDLTVEEGQRLKVIYGSSVGFHVIDVDSGNPYDIYIPSHVSLCVCLNVVLPFQSSSGRLNIKCMFKLILTNTEVTLFLMNERVRESETGWGSEGKHEIMNTWLTRQQTKRYESVNKLMNEWVIWVNEQDSEGANDQASKGGREWVSEWINKYMMVWASVQSNDYTVKSDLDCINKWLTDWMNEWIWQ